MKSFVIIASVLAASQCAPEPSGGPKGAPKAPDAGAAHAAAPDVGAEPPRSADAGPARGVAAWVEPGPPPFTVPTKRVHLDGLGATMLVPVGVRVEARPAGVLVLLGEGDNFAMNISDSASDLSDVSAMLRSETVELPERDDGAVVWNEDGRWYFQVAGMYSCWNPGAASHGKDDVEMMIASCKSIATDADKPAP